MQNNLEEENKNLKAEIERLMKLNDIYLDALNTIDSDDIIVSAEECARIAKKKAGKIK